MKHNFVNLCFISLLITLLNSTCKKNKPVSALSNGEIKYFNGSGKDRVKSVNRTLDNGFIYSGYSEKNGNTDAFLMKIDQNGEMQWYKTFGGLKLDVFNDAIALSDSGFVGVGFTNSEGFDTTNATRSAFAVKVDKNGALVWKNTYGSLESDLNAVMERKDHVIIMTGYSIAENYNINLTAANADGTLKFFKYYPLTQNVPPLNNITSWFDYGTALNVLDDGRIVVGGLMSKSWLKVEVRNMINFTMVTSVNGTENFMYPNYESARESGFFNAVTASSIVKKYYTVKILKVSDGFLIATTLELPGSRFKIRLIKTDLTANIYAPLWQKQYEGLGNVSVNDIVENSDGNFLLTGASSSQPLNYSYPEYFDGQKTMLLKIDKSGNELWTQYIGAETNASIGKCAQDGRNGGLSIAGYTCLSKEGYNKMFWIELDKEGKFIK